MSKNTNIAEFINYVSIDGSGNVVATTGIKKSGGTSSQFLKADGSVDASTYATQTYVTTAVSNLVASAPSTLDTLNELATALGNDANFATTVSTSIGNRVPYTGATGSVDLGNNSITAAFLVSTTSGSGKIRMYADYAQNYIESYDSSLSSYSKIVFLGGAFSMRSALATVLFDVDSSGNVAVGQSASGSFKFNVVGTGKFSGQLTLGSTITNGTYTYTLPSATGTLALTSNIPTNNNTLTNGAGYITSYTETDTLASVTGRGATTSTAVTFSNTLSVGSTIYSNTGNEYLRNTAGAVNNAQFQTWFNSVGTRRGYFGYGSGGSNTLELNNESGGQVILNGGDIIANGEYFRMKGAGGSAEFIWYKNYSGSPSEPGFVINNRAGATTFSHNANGGGTAISGNFTAAGAISGSNFSGSHSGTSTNTNTGDQYDINGNAATSTTTGSVQGRSRGSFTVGGNTSTFYPVAFGIGSGSTSRQGIAVIQIERGGYDEPGYTGLGFSTFHCRIRAKADGWGYGASYVQVEANAYTIPMLADVTQQNQTSQLIVWLRGGSSYNWLDLEGTAGLNFGNPSGTTYVTFSGAVTYSSTATNTIGSNFKYQQGWGDNYISGKLTAATATFNLNASSILTLTAAGTNASMIKAGSGDELYLGGNDTWQMRFSGGNILMDNGGRVGIGTSSPEQALHVTDSGSDTVMKLGGGGAARDTNFSIYSQSAGNTVTAIHYNGSMGFYNGKFNIASSGSATLTGTLTQNSSDIRLKENIIPINNALSKIEQLTGFTYTWNELANRLTGFSTSIQEVGLSAQSVQIVLPEAVFPAPFDNEFDPATQSYKSKSGENYLTVQYEKLVPLLVEAIKELKVENDLLKDRLDKNNIN